MSEQTSNQTQMLIWISFRTRMGSPVAISDIRAQSVGIEASSNTTGSGLGSTSYGVEATGFDVHRLCITPDRLPARKTTLKTKDHPADDDRDVPVWVKVEVGNLLNQRYFGVELADLVDEIPPAVQNRVFKISVLVPEIFLEKLLSLTINRFKNRPWSLEWLN